MSRRCSDILCATDRTSPAPPRKRHRRGQSSILAFLFPRRYATIGLPPGPARPTTPSYTPPCLPLLPPQSHSSPRHTLVLDLDETLVCSSFTRSSPLDVPMRLNVDGTMQTVFVRKRPGVEKFLGMVAEWFEVVVFTASVPPYADAVMDLLDPSGAIHHRLFREHCAVVGGYYVKDLRMLGRPLERTIIVDNSPRCYSLQRENALPVSTFVDNDGDSELLECLEILERARMLDDVRYCRV